MDELLEQLKALADGTRLKIFKLVEREELCVCTIVAVIGLSQPTVSNHLAKLKRAGLVKERPAGQWSHHSVDREGLARFRAALEGFLKADLADMPAMGEIAARLEEEHSREAEKGERCQ